MLVAFSPSDAAYLALAVFLVAAGLGLGYALLRLGGTFGRLSAFIRGTERELLPVISKVGDSVDRVNTQLDKLEQATDSAVDAVEAVDEAEWGFQATMAATIERDGGDKPVCVAELVFRYYK